ncbi:Fc.00g016950.m01.CDS01 [Cosmosporella sp. VM-42]
MAFWVVDGGRSLGTTGRGPFYVGGKRRVSHSEGSDGNDAGRDFVYAKRARFGAGGSGEDGYAYGQVQGHGHGHSHHHPHTYASAPSLGYGLDDDYYHDHDQPNDTPPPDSIAIQNLSFLVIRERSPTPEPPPAACGMERTESGLSISSDTTQHSIESLGDDSDDDRLLGDLEAARLVRDHVAGFRRRCPDSQHGRILKALINPKSREADFPLDNDALRSIFSAANELFFANRLTGRVAWDWSHPASEQYEAHIVGTTALRRSRLGGYETLIVLSSPILKDTKYNRRLLISTFLHEMIHSYLFITCGLKARHCGGHTEGFRQVAETIDIWVGREYLRLSDMEADLERFRDHHCGSSNIVEDERRTRGGSPRRRWHGRAERDRDDYYPTEPSRPRGHDEWQWYEREGFRARNAYAGGSPYV